MKLCGFEVGIDKPFFLIAGPCVVESEQLQMDVAGRLKEVTTALGIPFIFKSSYDKANRSSGTSFRGPGMDKGLEILAKVRRELKLAVLTDVHGEAEIAAVAKVVDVLQTPAFLSRQTDFIRAVAQSGKPVNIKKGQFLAPHDMKNVIAKARAAAREKGLPEDNFMVCERGVSFGYNNLVSDMRSLAIMRESGAPVVPGYFESAAVITTLVLLGQVLELRARSQTSSAIKELLRLAPENATIVRDDGNEEIIDLRHVQAGQTLRVKANEKVPTDGEITEGQTSIDESMVTGESMPVEKQ